MTFATQAPLAFHKPRKRRSNPESRLQVVVCDHLRLRGVPGLMFFKIDNERKCSPRIGLYRKRMGVRAGVSDLFVGVPGYPPAFLELKSNGQKPTKEQIAFMEHCRKLGYWTRVADNIDDAIDILIAWGAIRPGTYARKRGIA